MVENDNEHEATELGDQASSSHALEPDHNDGANRSVEQGVPRHSALSQHSLKTFWRRQIAITVHHEDSRDHFALERTYLGYMRTSLAFAILGISMAQLFRLQNQETTNPTFGPFDLAIPVASVCIGCAMVITVLGSWRFWRQQNALARGKIHAGGWEINSIAVFGLLTVVTIFVLVLVIEIDSGDD
ncbi:hypothetical protein MMC13_006246 [Lambiella insularis]|nr:hypothetical protein [Lambiella insularis]